MDPKLTERITIRMSPKLAKRLALASSSENRSPVNLARLLIERGLDEFERRRKRSK